MGLGLVDSFTPAPATAPATTAPNTTTKIPYDNGFYAGPYNPSLPVIDTGGGGGVVTTGGGAAAAPAFTPDAAAIAAFDQSIGNTQAGINRLDSQQAAGYKTIDDQTATALQQLLLGKNQANKVYDSNVLGTKQDYVVGKNTVGANAGSSLTGLLRLLGAHGAGGGSAYRITAPGAVAREATIQRNGLGQDFGKNLMSLDNNWGNYMTGYNNEVTGVNTQNKNAKSSLANTIATNRANLLQTLASLSSQKELAASGNAASSVAAAQPFINQANTLLDQAAGYTPEAIKYNTLAYAAPTLDKYNVGQFSKPTFQGQSPSNDYYTPALGALLGDKKKSTTAA